MNSNAKPAVIYGFSLIWRRLNTVLEGKNSERNGHELPGMRSGDEARLFVRDQGRGLQLRGRSAQHTAKRKARSGVRSDNTGQAQPPNENRSILLRELQGGPVPVLTRALVLPGVGQHSGSLGIAGSEACTSRRQKFQKMQLI